MSAFARISALAAVAKPYDSSHLGRDVPAGHFRSVLRASRAVRRRELRLLELANQRIEGAVEDSCQIARRKSVTEQRLRVEQLLSHFLDHGELDRELLSRKRR